MASVCVEIAVRTVCRISTSISTNSSLSTTENTLSVSGQCRRLFHTSTTVLVSTSRVAATRISPRPIVSQCSALMKASIAKAFSCAASLSSISLVIRSSMVSIPVRCEAYRGWRCVDEAVRPRWPWPR